jgi:hypothetical protein
MPLAACPDHRERRRHAAGRFDNPRERAWPCRAPFRRPAISASELFKQGRLKDAIDAQLQEVKAQPADHGERLFLFELASFAGDLGGRFWWATTGWGCWSGASCK